MAELTEIQRQLLTALVQIEDCAKVEARVGGCHCGAPIPGNEGRFYPYALFNSDECIGKPFDQIPWKMMHEPGCPMDGQEGVG